MKTLTTRDRSTACPRSAVREVRAFTLIELLTVIAIIAVLASIAVGLTSVAKSARVNSRMKAELHQLETAIEAYKGDRNAYPPDHRLPVGSPVKVHPAVNPLYYELRGVDVVNGEFRTRGGGSTTLSPADVERAFGRRGFLNASVDPAEPARTYFDPKVSGVRIVAVDGIQVELLVIPFDWPQGAEEPAPVSGSRVNPWRYVSTGATNNPGSYDLWAEVQLGRESDKKRVFKNW